MSNASKLEENVQFTYDQKSPIEGEFQIKFDGSFVDERMNQAFTDLQKRVREKGFRPGKVPLSLIRQKYREDVYHDVYNRLVYDSFVAAVQKEKVRTAGEPEITSANLTDWKPGQQVEFTARVDLVPEVKLKKVKGLSLEQTEASIGEEDVQKTIDRILDQRAELLEVEGRALQEKDFAVIDFVGSVDGVVQEDAKATNFMLELVDNNAMPEFKEKLMGCKPGDEKTIEVTYPQDFANKNIAGKTVSYEVKVHEIKEKKLPELTDEVAKDFQAENVDDLKKKIRESLEKEQERESKNELQGDAIAKLIEANPFDIPKSLKGRQLQVIYRDVTQLLEQQRFSKDLIDEYIRRHHGELEARAEKEVKLALLLNKLVEEEKLEATDADIDARLQLLADEMQATKEEIAKYYTADAQKKEGFASQLTREKALDFIIDNAKVKKVKPKKE